LRNYYDMLSVARNAPADDIKKAFRREIARYHPDKVQHLGKEFQDMASGIAADLTEAYRILMDPELRAKYDEELADGRTASPVPPAPQRPAAPAPPPPAAEPSTFSERAAAPPRPTAGIDFVRRAAISKIREALDDVLAASEPFATPGFDIALVTKPKKALFRKAEDSICLLVRFVAFVDEAAVTQFWTSASKVKAPGADGCVLMLAGPGMSPARELAAALTEQRRKLKSPGPVLVPVDVRDWDALFPPEAPGAVRALIQRLRDEKR
jgi:DnaJ domain